MIRTLPLALSGGAVPSALLRADIEEAYAAFFERVGLRAAGQAMGKAHSVVHERGAHVEKWTPVELISGLAADAMLREQVAVVLLRTGTGEAMAAETDCRRAVTRLAALASNVALRLEDNRLDAVEAGATADELAALLPLLLISISDCRAKAQAVRS